MLNFTSIYFKKHGVSRQKLGNFKDRVMKSRKLNVDGFFKVSTPASVGTFVSSFLMF